MLRSHLVSRLAPTLVVSSLALSACGKKAEPTPTPAPTAPAPTPTPDTAPAPTPDTTEPTTDTAEPTADTAAPTPDTAAPTPDTAATPGAPTQAESPDLASFAYGARVVSQSPAESEPQPAWLLLDERPDTWFGGTDEQRTNVSAIIELAAPARLAQLGVAFDVDEIHAKDLPDGLTLEVSASADGPWQLVTTHTPPAVKHNHLVAPDPAVTARYIRVTMPRRLAENYQGPLVGELIAHGTFTDTIPPLPSPVGTWNGGWLLPTFELAEINGKLVGCFVDDGTPLSATTEGRTLTLRWKSESSTHIAMLVPDNNALAGSPASPGLLRGWRSQVQTFTGQDAGDTGLSPVEKIDAAPSPCIAALKGESAPKSEIETALEKGEKAIVYSILFDFDSDRIRPESKPILDEIAKILERHPDWKLDIAGHTDSVGSDTYNLTLSERRAKSTITALIERGIAADRLSAQGLGEGAPLVSNDTAPGRAQNRRVELTRK